MNSEDRKSKLEESPTKQRTPRQLSCQKKVGIYFAQSKNAMDTSSIITGSSESDEEDLEGDLPEKGKKRTADPLAKKLTKIRKTFDNNITIANEESEEIDTETSGYSSEKPSPKKILQISSSSNVELTTKTKSTSSNDIIVDNKENISETQGTLDGLDDLFEEEWTYTKKEKESVEMLDDFFEDDWSYEKENTIDFSKAKRCIIIDISKMFMKWLQLSNVLEPGFIISQPDTLVSGTSVVGALFCNRRSTLQEKFRLIESLPHNNVGNNYMLTGSLTHELFQTVLDEKITDAKKISTLLDDILKSRNAIQMMYSAGISRQDCRNLMLPAVGQIHKFIQRYIVGIEPETPDQNYNGKIEKICDIEENVWLPSLGLKGKIDLTIEVSQNKSKNKMFPNVERKVVPLELKTGRSSFSSEHQGQLILYTMMMNETGRKADSGLLLYLRENIMREIIGSNNAQRDLITLRNTVAYYSTRQPTIVKTKEEESVLPMEFPKPINHRACAQCPYNTLCTTYLTEEEKKELSVSHPLKAIDKKVADYLTQEHIDYVTKWVSLLQIEEDAENQDLVSWKDVWTLDPLKREKRGSCISNLNLVSVSEINGRYLHKFQRLDINATDFCENEYVIISTMTRINVCSGFIDSVSSETVTVHCDKNITKVYKDTVFHIDKSSSNSFLVQNMSHVGGLLDDYETCSQLRKIIIERKPATFQTELPPSIMEVGEDIFKKINEHQKQAILQALRTDNYLLIKGFPGTGKTQTLVALIELLLKLDKSVLITAHTNTAVDNILLKLIERKIDFIRFGNSTKAHPNIAPMLEANVTEHCDSPESLHTVYCSKKVVGVTCYGATHAHLSRRKFDICIVDESTQVLQPTLLRPLYSASKFILVGDPEQLPPIAKNNTARKLGMNESLFSRLDSKNNAVVLKLQYRMNSCIMDIANKLTYHDQLQIGCEKAGKATMPVTNIAEFESCEKWIRKTLSLRLKNSAIFLNTSATYHLTLDETLEERKGSSNYWEAAMILRLIEVLKKLGIDTQTIGVIAPYRVQVHLLRKVVPNDIEVNTVDQYQGRDKSVIIYSCSKSISKDTKIQEFDILEDQQRLTVAVTRAKHKLIIIGDINTLQRFTPFNKLITAFRSHERIYDLKDGEDDFSFTDLLRLLL
ncbi:hypothetical protein TSAR_005441 [Trichomalopsis sarcophagae]|uniref:DNA replication ATP-dependent helicase/nuclease n=1 Tax=Trichomalopsis sarcophagae TaxID=543379 RepID=A0A232F8M5_9HYME|nr:hypothetical protein TSAR_005441 [Trichomalopsis sarcophagae]